MSDTDRFVKTCKYGHHWYTGQTCPLCDYLGRENLRKVHTGTDHPDYTDESDGDRR